MSKLYYLSYDSYKKLKNGEELEFELNGEEIGIQLSDGALEMIEFYEKMQENFENKIISDISDAYKSTLKFIREYADEN